MGQADVISAPANECVLPMANENLHHHLHSVERKGRTNIGDNQRGRSSIDGLKITWTNMPSKTPTCIMDVDGMTTLAIDFLFLLLSFLFSYFLVQLQRLNVETMLCQQETRMNNE
jgi:hypothetical protein